MFKNAKLLVYLLNIMYQILNLQIVNLTVLK